MVAPPGIMPGTGCVVLRHAFILTVVPLVGQVRMQRLQRIALAGSFAGTDWTAGALIHLINLGLPSVRLSPWALVTNPVSTFVAATCDLAGIQACCGICIPVPQLRHRMVTLCQSWVPILCLSQSRLVFTAGAPMVILGTVYGTCSPLMTIRALPVHFLPAASHDVMWGAMVSFTPLGCNFRSLGGQRVVRTNTPACTERAASTR